MTSVTLMVMMMAELAPATHLRSVTCWAGPILAPALRDMAPVAPVCLYCTACNTLIARSFKINYIHVPVSVGCGGKSSENCTHFESGESESIMEGGCSAAICPCTHNICQVYH